MSYCFVFFISDDSSLLLVIAAGLANGCATYDHPLDQTCPGNNSDVGATSCHHILS